MNFRLVMVEGASDLREEFAGDIELRSPTRFLFYCFGLQYKYKTRNLTLLSPCHQNNQSHYAMSS